MRDWSSDVCSSDLGDAFIARLIVGIVSGEEPSLALREAARSAAATCSYYGAFGHPRAYRPVAE